VVAAQFIYLNKTCFNGLYRVNRRGEFNVPMGRYTNPNIADGETLMLASAALHKADLRCTPFETLLSEVRPGDFVYMDPPYEPLSRTANFTSYAQDGFTQEKQTDLRNVFRELDRRGAKLMLSNSDVPFIRNLYRGYEIEQVFAPRAVSCDAKSRGPVSEVVVRNYR
jgi:DNA adenine methylase